MDIIKLNSELLAQRIVTFREKCGWNQADLARQAKITSAALSEIEKGGRLPLLQTTVNLAAALGISVDELVGLDSFDQNEELRELRVFKKNNELFGALPKHVHKMFVDLANAFLNK